MADVDSKGTKTPVGGKSGKKEARPRPRTKVATAGLYGLSKREFLRVLFSGFALAGLVSRGVPGGAVVCTSAEYGDKMADYVMAGFVSVEKEEGK